MLAQPFFASAGKLSDTLINFIGINDFPGLCIISRESQGVRRNLHIGHLGAFLLFVDSRFSPGQKVCDKDFRWKSQGSDTWCPPDQQQDFRNPARFRLH